MEGHSVAGPDQDHRRRPWADDDAVWVCGGALWGVSGTSGRGRQCWERGVMADFIEITRKRGIHRCFSTQTMAAALGVFGKTAGLSAVVSWTRVTLAILGNSYHHRNSRDSAVILYVSVV